MYDGGSTDDSLEVLRGAGGRVRWVSAPDGGQSDALNRAFENSSGEIVGWLNADDGYADRRAVEWAVREFLARPEVDALFGHTLLVNESNTILQVRAAPPFSVRALRAVNYILQPSVFVRRAAVERLGTFVRADLHYVMDRDLLLRLGAFGEVGDLRRSSPSTVTSGTARPSTGFDEDSPHSNAARPSPRRIGGVGRRGARGSVSAEQSRQRVCDACCCRRSTSITRPLRPGYVGSFSRHAGGCPSVR